MAVLPYAKPMLNYSDVTFGSIAPPKEVIGATPKHPCFCSCHTYGSPHYQSSPCCKNALVYPKPEAINLGTYIQGEKETMEEVAKRVEDDAIRALQKRPVLLGWIRKIASDMFPQTTRGDYSHGEVENLLIVVGVKHEELLKEERQRVVEMIKQKGEVMKGDLYLISLFDIQDKQNFPSDKETIPKGYILNPVEDGVAKYIKKKLEIKKWDNELCKIGKVSMGRKTC